MPTLRYAAFGFLAAVCFHTETGHASDDNQTSGWRVPITTGVDPEKRDYYEDLGRKSDKILNDRSFVEKWRKPGTLQTPQQAEIALDEAEKAIDLLDRAVKNKTAACYYTFLVNRCIGDAKKRSFERQREIRDVMTDARTILHKEKAEENARKKAERLSKPFPQPVGVEPKAVKPVPAEPPVKVRPKEVQPESVPGNYPKKEVKAPSKPSAWEAKKVRNPTEPSGYKLQEEKAPSMPSGMKAIRPDAAPEQEYPTTREALEQANLRALAEKEAEAAERQRQADEKAKARKAKREARNKRFKEDQEKRRAAQLEYEKEQKEGKKSGIFNYF